MARKDSLARAAYQREYRKRTVERRREYGRAWFLANREKSRASNRKSRAKYRDRRNEYERKRYALATAFIDAARAGGCVDCGEKDLRVLESDHVRGKKVAPVSRMRGGSLRDLFAELDKCETRCANCHARITAIRLAQRQRLRDAA